MFVRNPKNDEKKIDAAPMAYLGLSFRKPRGTKAAILVVLKETKRENSRHFGSPKKHPPFSGEASSTQRKPAVSSALEDLTARDACDLTAVHLAADCGHVEAPEVAFLFGSSRPETCDRCERCWE